MNKIFHIILFALVGLMITQNAKAQQVDMNTGLVVWKGSTLDEALTMSSNGGFVYLVEFKQTLNPNDKELYLNAGGNYGVQAILSSVGMRMQIRQSQDRGRPNNNRTAYQFVTRIDNLDNTSGYLGDCMGYDNQAIGGHYSIYLDRGNKYNLLNGQANNFPNWELISSPQTKTGIRYKNETSNHPEDIQTYILRSNDNRSNYITVSNGRLITTNTQNQATKWIIISEDDFDEAMQAVTWGEVDLGVFVQDAEFGRDNKDGYLWVWKNAEIDADGNTLDGRSLNTNPQHWHQRNQDIMCNGYMLANGISHQNAGTNVTGNGNQNIDHNSFRMNYGQYYCAEIYNEVNSLTQTLHGATIPNLIDGLYKLTAQALYYDDVNGLTNDGVAYFVVKRDVLDDNGNIVDTSTEYLPITPMNKDSRGSYIKTHSGISAGYEFDNHQNAYLLTAFVEITGKVNLTIGIEQREAKGWTVIGNLHLYAHGKQAMYVDEDWTNNETLVYVEGDNPVPVNGNPYDLSRWHDNYDYPSTVYYQRTFTKDAWNPICMPLELTGRQVRQAFGANAKVCAFKGQHDTQKSLLYFERALDLDQAENMDKIVIEAGVPYIIYVENEPQHPNGITAEVGNGNSTTDQNHTIHIEGKTYAIPGVLKEQVNAYVTGNETDGFTLKEPQVVNGAGGFKMVGSFYATKINKENVRYDYNGETSGNTSGNNYWVITKGNMYHLAGQNDYNIWATYAYIYLPPGNSSSAKEFSFAIDDGTGIDEVTTIEGLEIYRGNQLENNDVYTLSGQKVGKGTLDGLPKGIYMMNGRKFVKK